MWNFEEALDYYRRQGAPNDQAALISLLREVQQEQGGSIPQALLQPMGKALGCKETFLMAVIRRIPSLLLDNTHTLELCTGPNCSKRGTLAAWIEHTDPKLLEGVMVRQVPCMRMCGKGPNIRWDGRLYHQADEKLLQSLLEEK